LERRLQINHTTYNLARMNMFLHNINYDKFNIQLGNTLIDPHFGGDKPFDAIVSNPPYSVNWIGSDDPTLINDERFAPAGVLAPKSKADFAFVLHALSYLSSKGRASIVCFPGIFYRSGAEQKIRQYLVDNNYVETVISLAPNLFFGTTISVNILVLSKHKTDTKTQFIDASGLFKKDTNNNILTDEHIEQIMQVFDSKLSIKHFAKLVPLENIAANDYNLSVSSYVETEVNREIVDITKLNSELKTTVTKIDKLRADIDATVEEIEGAKRGMSGTNFMEKLLDGDEVEWKTLGEIGNFIRGKRFVKTDLVTEGTPCIHYGEMYTHYGIWAKESKSFLDKELASKLRVANHGDVIIVAAGETIEDIGNGTAWLGKDDVVIHDACFSYKSKLNPKYVSYFLRTNLFKDQIKKSVSSGKISAINSTGLSKAKIPVPSPENPEKSLKIQAEIVRKLDAFTELTAGLTAELTARKMQYNYYRDLLLKFPKPKEVAK
jgi:type I restriction enzyme M protein